MSGISTAAPLLTQVLGKTLNVEETKQVYNRVSTHLHSNDFVCLTLRRVTFSLMSLVDMLQLKSGKLFECKCTNMNETEARREQTS